MAVFSFLGSPRIERRTLVALGLAAFAAFVVLALTRSDASINILAAAHDLTVGAPLDDDSVTVRQVDNADGLVVGSSIGELEGWLVSVPLSAGEPLIPSLLVEPGASPEASSLSISVPESDAALGTIAAGDLVNIYVTWPASANSPVRTELLASAVEVLETRPSDDVSAGRRSLHILFAVDETLAPLIAGGHRIGELDLVRIGK